MIKLYISKDEPISQDCLYADQTKLVSWFEETECELENEDCKLLLLEDRLAEERRKVVQEIRNYVCNKYTHIDEEIVNGNHTFFYSIHCRSFLKKLDQIERKK